MCEEEIGGVDYSGLDIGSRVYAEGKREIWRARTADIDRKPIFHGIFGSPYYGYILN